MSTQITTDQLLAMATVFEVFNDRRTKQVIRVESRPIADEHAWVVVNEARFLMNHDGGWEYDPPLFNPDDVDFYARTRWDNAAAAIEAAQQHMVATA